MKIKDIFTPGRFPTVTFVDEHLKEREQQLHDALDDGSMLVSISGPSKSGKTVFVEHILGKDNLVPITGAGVRSTDDVWIRVFDLIGTPISNITTFKNSTNFNLGVSTSGEANIFVAKGTAAATSSGGYASQKDETRSDAIDFLQLLIKELANTNFVVFIDDFHYIPQDIQSYLAQQIKEAIRKGVKIICASVPYHADDVIRSNPDLRGRIYSIDFDYWGSEVLEKIALKGFREARITCDIAIIHKLVAEAAGSPQLMQYLCLNTCYEIGVKEIPEIPVVLIYDSSIFENICKRTVQSADYSSVVNKMIDGPKTRGSDRKIHLSKYGWQGDVYKFLIKALSLDPPSLNFRYQPLVDRIESICKGDSPSGSSITSACLHSAAIANDTAGDSIVEWDGENDVFDIRDPYLLFYLRWAEVIE